MNGLILILIIGLIFCLILVHLIHSFLHSLQAYVVLELETLNSMMSLGIALERDCKLSYGCSFICIKIGRRRFLANGYVDGTV